MNVELILPETARVHFKLDGGELALLQSFAGVPRPVKMFGASIYIKRIEVEFLATQGSQSLHGEATIHAFFAGHEEREKLVFG